jgi:hypothetical protein
MGTTSFIGQPTYDNLLHVILNKSKLAYRIYVILIANKELKKLALGQKKLTPVNVEKSRH